MSTFIKENKVSIGCRISQEKKDELIELATDSGFNSFSQFLEHLIINAADKFENSVPDNSTNLIKDSLKDLGKKIEALSTSIEYNAHQNDLDNWLTYFSKVLGLKKEIEIEALKTILKDNFTKEEFLKATGIKNEVAHNLCVEYGNFYFYPRIEVSDDVNETFTELCDFMIYNEIAKDHDDALILITTKFLEEGDGIFEKKPYTKEFLPKFNKLKKEHCHG